MDGITSAAAGLNASGAMGKVNIAMLKKTQDLVASQMSQLLESMPTPKSSAPVGNLLDVQG